VRWGAVSKNANSHQPTYLAVFRAGHGAIGDGSAPRKRGSTEALKTNLRGGKSAPIEPVSALTRPANIPLQPLINSCNVTELHAIPHPPRHGSLGRYTVKASYQVTGSNSKAPFTLTVHRGDGMALLAMNWRKGQPPRTFVGFAIEFREPGNQQFHPIKNRIAFPGQRKTSNDPPVDSTEAPFQKFRWVSFPVRAGKEGTFTYRVTPMFMDQAGKLTDGESQTASIALMRETIRGKLNIAFTRG
jgi:hypothetical protein